MIYANSFKFTENWLQLTCTSRSAKSKVELAQCVSSFLWDIVRDRTCARHTGVWAFAALSTPRRSAKIWTTRFTLSMTQKRKIHVSDSKNVTNVWILQIRVLWSKEKKKKIKIGERRFSFAFINSWIRHDGGGVRKF